MILLVLFDSTLVLYRIIIFRSISDTTTTYEHLPYYKGELANKSWVQNSRHW